jgi:protein SCO1/2
MSIRDDRRLRALSAIAVVSLLALLVLAAVFIANAKSTAPSAPGFKDATVYPGGSSPPAPVMRLEDAASGEPFNSATLAGRPYVVTFLYTHCPDVCPLIGAELQQALSALGPEARKTEVVALSVDPRGDTRAAVRAWLHVHHEPANFHYLIGDEAELKPYWNAWHVGPQIVGDPDSSHTAAIYLITRRSRIAGIVDAGTQVPISDLVYDFRSLIRN